MAPEPDAFSVYPDGSILGQRVTEDGVTPMIRGGFEILDEIAEEAWRDLAERLALERKRNERQD